MPFSGRCGPLLLTRIVFFSHSCYTERDSLCGREENILIERLCRWSVPAFLLLEGALYLSFLALDLLSPGPLSTALKYAALLLCLLMALAGASRGGDRLVAAALAMTARPTSSCWCWTAGTSWASSSFTGSRLRIWSASVRPTEAMPCSFPGSFCSPCFWWPCTSWSSSHRRPQPRPSTSPTSSSTPC